MSHVMVGGPLFGQMEAQKCEASVKLIACLYILYHVYAKSIPLWSCHVKISMIYAMFMPCQCHLTISNRTRISNPLEGPAEPRGALEPIQHLHVSVRALADSDQRLATNRWILAMALAYFFTNVEIPHVDMHVYIMAMLFVYIYIYIFMIYIYIYICVCV